MKKIFFITIILMTFFIGKAYADEYDIPEVLILQSYHSGFLWADNIDTAIKTVLKEYNHNIRIKTEFLDTKRFNTPEFKDNLKMMLEYKYKDSDFDVIITADNNAFEIVKDLHKSVFKEAPVVFCGVNYFHPSQLEGMRNVTGVREKIISLENFKLIKTIHKDVKKIIVINEMTPTGLQNRINIHADIREFKEDIDIEIVEDVSIEELKLLLSNLKDDTIVLYSLFFKDNQGQFLEYDESALLVSRYSSVPVYVSIDFSLGYGAVGGYLTSGSLQGESAAKLAIQILQGNDAEKLDIIDVSPNGYYFDYKAMQKWGLSIKDIPQNSFILNYQQSYFQRNKDIILRFTLVVLFLSIIIFWMIITIIKKNKLKNELVKSNKSLTDLKQNLEFMVDERTQELRSEEKKYRSVYENSGIAMITVAKNGIVTMVNNKFEVLSGYSKEEVENKLSWITFIDQVDIDKMKENRKKRYTNQLPPTDSYEVKFLNKKGFVIDAILNIVLVPETSEIISSITDITAKNTVQKKMQYLLEEQKAFNEVKNNFYSNFGKDMNVPLNAIYGLVDLIETNTDENTNTEYYKLLKDLTRQLLYIVNEMTEYHINREKEKTEIRRVYLPDFIKYILEFFIDRTNIEKIYYRLTSDYEEDRFLAVSQLEKLIEIIIIKLAKNDPKLPIFVDITTTNDDSIKFDISTSDKNAEKDFTLIDKTNEDYLHDLSKVSELRFNYLVINKLISSLEGKVEYSSDINQDKKFIFTIKNYTENDVSENITDNSDVNSIEKYILNSDLTSLADKIADKIIPLKVLIVNYSNVDHYVLFKIAEALNQKIDICTPEQDLKDFLVKNTYDVIFIDLTVVSINDIDTLRDISQNNSIYKPYIIANIENSETPNIYDFIDTVFPDTLTKASLALLLESALEYKNKA